MFRRKREIALVGCGPLARETARDLSRTARVVGAFSVDAEPVRPDLGVPHLGDVKALAAYLESNPVDEVYLATGLREHHATLQSAVATCELLGTPFAVPAHVFRFERALPRHPRSVSDGYLHYRSTNGRPVKDALKRSADVVLSGAGLVALLPLFIVVAALIKVTSKGPVFFKQVRVGLRGRQFHMYKFRSMVVDADRQLATLMASNEQTGPVFKMRNDPRVTAIGRVIRRYSIDELPQLLNVFRGTCRSSARARRAQRGRALPAVAAPAALGDPGPDLLLAGSGRNANRLRRVDAARPAVRRPVVRGRRPEADWPHRARGRDRSGRRADMVTGLVNTAVARSAGIVIWAGGPCSRAASAMPGSSPPRGSACGRPTPSVNMRGRWAGRASRTSARSRSGTTSSFGA